MTFNSKVENYYKKHQNRFTPYEFMDMNLKNTIMQMLQDMYDLGHADGYADYYYDHMQNVKLEPVENILL